MYKALFKLIIAIISQPSRTWKMLEIRYFGDGKEEVAPKDYELFLSRYLYPFLGLLTVAAFFSICTRQEFDLEIALKSSVVSFVSAFGGFHLASYVVNEIWGGFFKQKKELQRFQLFVGFGSALLYTLNIIWLLLPDFFFLYIFVLYTVYIVWEGTTIFLKIEENLHMKMTVLLSAFIMGSPKLIEFFLTVLMPGLHK